MPKGFRSVVEILYTATILHNGWESDNKGWIVRMADGRVKALTTSHGSVCAWPGKEMAENLRETEDSATSIRQAMDLMVNKPASLVSLNVMQKIREETEAVKKWIS